MADAIADGRPERTAQSPDASAGRPRARMSFAHLPTPLEPADRLGRELGLGDGRLWIKRDDLTGLATGGNKARKLELLVPDAQARGADTLVTAGGPQSNHARTTAAAAARAGLHCILAFNADPPPRTEGNQLLDALFGAERRFVGRMAMEELNAAVDVIADEVRARGGAPYVIPIGGSSALGASAYADAAGEIVEQIGAAVGHEDVVVVTACGSGGTQAGLAARLGHERVLGVHVGAVRDPAAVVRPLAREVAELVGLPAPTGEPWMITDQVGDGYGAPTDACLAALRLVARTEGLLLDPVYSGKGLAGLIAHLGEIPARAIVFLASGGVPALFTSRYEEWLTS
jgi:D-cysteine desulfhydrase